MKRCLKCNSLMPDDVAHCIRCGSEAGKTAGTAPAAPHQSSARPSTPPTHQVNAPGPVMPRRGDEVIRRQGARAGEGVAKRGRIRSGWALATRSWRVLMLNKELLLFPLLSGFSCFLVLASFAGGIWASGMGRQEAPVNDTVGFALLFAYYFANYFVIVFFNSALVACAMIRFRGGDPTVSNGLRAAVERLAQITAWALLAATVGVVLRIIEQRAEFIGRIVISLLGAAWTIATYFAVPVLVVEKLGPFDALKRSAMIMKKAWGESLVSNVGMGLITFLVALALTIVIGIATAVLAIQMGSVAVALTGLGVILVILLLVALVSSALSSIVLSALDVYAAEDKLPEVFEGAGLQEAFVTR